MSVLTGQVNLTPTGLSGEQYQSEISAYAKVGEGLFIFSSGGGTTLQVTDATDLSAPVLLERIDYGGYTSTSVAVYGDLLAVALVPADYNTTPERGVVRFFRIGDNGSLSVLEDVTVGYLPDGIEFTPNGRKLVVANEGQPDDSYTTDPVGSVGIIQISQLRTSSIAFEYTDLTFESVELTDGVRLSGPSGTTQAGDIEPEYVAIDKYGDFAYVTLQENNAVAVVDLRNNRIKAIHEAGSVDYSKMAVDLTDKDVVAGTSLISPKLGQSFSGLRMPDGISAYGVNGVKYYITANEGDAREYDDYEDVSRGSSTWGVDRLQTLLDPAPDGERTETSIGSRSISIFKASTGDLLWDSGTSLQTIAIAARTYSDARSDDKGVEVEGVITTRIGNRNYAIAALERPSSTTVVVYDVNNPSEASYVSHYVVSGSVSPEGLKIITAEESTNGRAQLLISNEVSNTLNVLDLQNLIDTPGIGSAGYYTNSMLTAVADESPLEVSSLITVGEFTKPLDAGDDLYAPTGIFDGIGAYDNRNGTYTVLVNSEIGSTVGLPYAVNDVNLTGARINKFIIDKDTDNNASNGYQSAVISGGIAYRAIVDATGEAVTSASQIDGGLDRFCSGSYEKAKAFGARRGFRDSIYLTGEESSEGLFYALDTKNEVLYALPGLGRGGWETAVQVDTKSGRTVGVLLMDDNTAPLYLWVGQKSTAAGASFLERNGLAAGQGSLYTWVPTDGSIGTELGTSDVPDSADLLEIDLGATVSGQWVQVGTGDEVATWNEATLRSNATALGALQLSRLEDANINPHNGQQVVFATTGNSAFGGADTFGNLITLDLSGAFARTGLIAESNSTDLRVIYDGDREIESWDLAHGNANGVIDTDEQDDFGATIIRNPDNLTWSRDGYLYVQEDRSVSSNYFLQQEASIWKVELDPISGVASPERWMQIDRSAVPSAYGQSDASPTDYGNWESSGIVDVSSIYGKTAGSFFLADVQAHSITGGNINANGYLVQGGQLNLIQNTDLF